MSMVGRSNPLLLGHHASERDGWFTFHTKCIDSLIMVLGESAFEFTYYASSQLSSQAPQQ